MYVPLLTIWYCTNKKQKITNKFWFSSEERCDHVDTINITNVIILDSSPYNGFISVKKGEQIFFECKPGHSLIPSYLNYVSKSKDEHEGQLFCECDGKDWIRSWPTYLEEREPPTCVGQYQSVLHSSFSQNSGNNQQRQYWHHRLYYKKSSNKILPQLALDLRPHLDLMLSSLSYWGMCYLGNLTSSHGHAILVLTNWSKSKIEITRFFVFT